MRLIHGKTGTHTTWVLGLMAAILLPGMACADVLHLYDGTLMRGKLKRVTGDIIEFRQDDMFGSRENLPRLRLSNRHDIVETLGGHKYYGEIFYVDKFKIDLKSVSGMVHINRLKVKTIVMGTPMQQPDLPNTTGAMPSQPLSAMPAQHHYSHAAPAVDAPPSTSSQSAYTTSTPMESASPELRGPTPENEDTDAIPAVDRAP